MFLFKDALNTFYLWLYGIGDKTRQDNFILIRLQRNVEALCLLDAYNLSLVGGQYSRGYCQEDVHSDNGEQRVPGEDVAVRHAVREPLEDLAGAAAQAPGSGRLQGDPPGLRRAARAPPPLPQGGSAARNSKVRVTCSLCT